jgi:hypothetical protein
MKNKSIENMWRRAHNSHLNVFKPFVFHSHYCMPLKIISGSWAAWGYIQDMQIATFTALGFKGSIDVAISATDVSEVILSAMFFLLTSPFKYNHMRIILDNFNKIDSVIAPILVKEMRTRSKFVQMFLIVFLPTMYVLDLLMWGNDSWPGVNNYFAFYVLNFVVNVHQLQYWNFVTLAHARILAINRFIKKSLSSNSF